MPLRTFISEETSFENDHCLLSRKESHHLIRVMRAKEGQLIQLLDGRGRIFDGEVKIASAQACQIAITDVLESPRRNCEIQLVQAITKSKSMDLIFRIATELGVSSIQPLFTDQGEVQIQGSRLEGKKEKWTATMMESCKQCGQPFLPELQNPTHFREWTEQLSDRQEAKTQRLVASLQSGTSPIGSAMDQKIGVRRLTIVIGPEGDFSAREYESLKSLNFLSVSLGQNVLRAETAVAYALAVVDDRLQNFQVD